MLAVGEFRFYRFEDENLDEESLLYLMQQRNENPETRKIHLEQLRGMILENKSLNPCLEENFLLRFLRGAKYDIHKAYNRMQKYYNLRNIYPDVFSNFVPSSTLQVQSLQHLTALPYRGKDKTVVIIVKMGNIDSSLASFEEILRFDLLILETLLINPATQLTGISFIFDLNGFSNQQIALFTPRNLRMCMDVFQYSSYMRIKNLHFINTPGLLYTLYRCLFPMMLEKYKDRTVAHLNDDNWESFHSYFPPEILPEEYGGQLKSSDMVNLNDILNEKEEVFHDRLQYRILESTFVVEEVDA
ncbi:retinaldehyde-binding protein 1-like isoform X1 [Stegodyphus dumicola]|uniref:retinaldehyde-binding protein 1-like isoform X1 n=1 Tax=Stegodyphus dumicola TaxID=202533 RepID=UPI0015B2C8F2|nr:retinaldehyde-binding protein 1-like isoform X1 [Stegodyphus dumicola]